MIFESAALDVLFCANLIEPIGRRAKVDRERVDDFEDVCKLFKAFVCEELGDFFAELLAKSGTELLSRDGLRFAGVSVLTDDVGDVIPDELVVGDGLHGAASFGVTRDGRAAHFR